MSSNPSNNSNGPTFDHLVDEQKGHTDVEAVQGEKRREIDPKITLVVLRGSMKNNFNFANVKQYISDTGSKATSVTIRKSKNRRANSGFVVFETAESLEQFLTKNCKMNEGKDGYTFPVNDIESLIFRRFDSEHVGKRNQEQLPLVKKLHISGLPVKDVQTFLSKFFSERKIELGRIDTSVSQNVAYATVIVKDGAVGAALVEESFKNRGIKQGESVLIIKKFYQPKNMNVPRRNEYSAGNRGVGNRGYGRGGGRYAGGGGVYQSKPLPYREAPHREAPRRDAQDVRYNDQYNQRFRSPYGQLQTPGAAVMGPGAYSSVVGNKRY